jgi:ABC-type multidrug transport system fused ATPase/permease subunit
VLGPDVEHLDHGLDSLVGTRGVRLSGGQVQRAAAARMLLTDADLLVFDDLSSALDVHTETQLWRRLFERRRATCLVVSHRRPALRRADQVVLMVDGRVADRGTLPELLERSAEMRALWEEWDEEDDD